MIIHDFSISNKYIDLSCDKIFLDKIGVYLIRGTNGAGKTTIIKEILFKNHQVVLNNEAQSEAYRNNRGALISYVPQDIVVPNCTVWEYISKGNTLVSESDARQYMSNFGLDSISLTDKTNRLSGGERSKLCIISAILKDTPYLFFDEPTNNLDDTSVEQLTQVIKVLQESRTVVIVSHDSRLTLDKYDELIITDNRIRSSENNGETNQRVPSKLETVSTTKMAVKLQKTALNIGTVALFITSLLALLFFNMNEFNAKYSIDVIPESNTILLYQVDYVYPNLNEYYVKSAKLDIPPDNFYTMMKYSDISSLSVRDDVESIYILDNLHLDNISDVLYSLETTGYDNYEPPRLSVPSFIYNNYSKETGLQNMLALKYGRIPADGMNELVLSENLIKEFFNDTDDFISLIDSKVEIEGTAYKLVGIGLYDFIWFSWTPEEDDCSIFYKYAPETFAQFSERSLQFQLDKDYVYYLEANNVVFTTTANGETTFLNYLMSNFPANNYVSSVFAENWIKKYNAEFLKNLFALNTALVMLASIIIIFAARISLADDLILLNDYGNYYILDKAAIRTYFGVRQIVRYCCLVAILVLSFVFSGIYTINVLLILADGIVMLLIEAICSWVVLRRQRAKS